MCLGPLCCNSLVYDVSYVNMALSMAWKTSILLFSVLLCHGSAFVPPATNLSLHCHNFINILRWDYSHHATLKPSFRVAVDALSEKPGPLQVDYPNLQCDLSAFSNPDNDYGVTVTALVGLNESLPAPPNRLTFSYFHSSLSEQKCSLDLPPINVTFQPDAGIKFRFSHPSVLYGQKLLLTKHKRRQKKPNKQAKEFQYTVVVTGDQKEYSYFCMKEVCEEVIEPGLQQDCVRIGGYWENIAVKSTQDYCALPAADTATANPAQLIGLAVFFAVGLLVLVFAFIYKRVRASSEIPFSLSFPERENCNHTQDLSHTPLIPDKLSPVSPGTYSHGDPITITAGDPNGVGSVQSTITAVEMEPKRPLPTGQPAMPNGSVPLAPRLEPAAGASGMDPTRNDPGLAARDVGQGDPGIQAQVGDDPGGAEGAPGPLPRDADMEEGARGGEPLDEIPNASGYEQRVRVELIPGDTCEAYLW